MDPRVGRNKEEALPPPFFCFTVPSENAKRLSESHQQLNGICGGFVCVSVRVLAVRAYIYPTQTIEMISVMIPDGIARESLRPVANIA